MFVCTLFEAANAADQVTIDGLSVSWIEIAANKMRFHVDAENHFEFEDMEIEVNDDGVSIVGENIMCFLKTAPITEDDV